ncbi:MAG: N-acetyl-gamma-glutamyl-phosphate reductase [Pseudomonadota bacterium]
MTARVALVGARGHTGSELVQLIDKHPYLTLAAAGSRALAGDLVRDHYAIDTALTFEALTPAMLGERDGQFDVVILALPNGQAPAYVEALGTHRELPLVIDLSADHRFDEAWFYGLPELTAKHYAGERLIANPGCYATAMSLVLAPVVQHLRGGVACFGVSGYSGAGTTPSPRNDPDRLRDNLLPYALTDHLHEREVSRHVGLPVAFTPHVAAFFRGISMTVTGWLADAHTPADLASHYADWYAEHPLVTVAEHIPEPRALVGRYGAEVGGFGRGGQGPGRITVVSALDNLLKGAASQAIQNINLGLALPPLTGLKP